MNIPISYKTLARYIDGIPNPSELESIFLAHICEVEGKEMRGEDTIFDLKITPDRGDLLSYRGIAREVVVHSEAKLKQTTNNKLQTTDTVAKLGVFVADEKNCPRYIGRVVEGVDGRASPAWLREALEASGQRSINAIVDVTNFVMLETGQPMHAFDADKLARDGSDEIKISVRNAEPREKIATLDGKDIVLPENTLVIADGARALAIAGVKGGAYAGVGTDSHTILLEAAIFDAVRVRKASRAVGITTDSSRRFEHHRAPEIARIAMERATELLLEIFPDARAGEAVDVYPRPASPTRLGVSAEEISRILGIAYSADDLARDLDRLGFVYERIESGAERIVSLAKKLSGTPYFFGASVRYDAPRKFDCSGFVNYLFLDSGIKIPRMAVDQFVFGEEVSLDNIEAGDLVFSVNEGSEVYHESVEWMKGTKIPEQGIDHVGVFVGDGMIAHASRYNKSVGEGGGVFIEKLLESPRFKNITGIRRIGALSKERFAVTAPAERFDICIDADIAEEIARIITYDNIPATPLTSDGFTPVQNGTYDAMLRVRNTLAPLGFSEIFTYVFRKEGKVEVINPMAEGISFLRDNLSAGMRESLIFNARNAPLLGVDEILSFEIGTVFFAPDLPAEASAQAGKEEIHISLGATVTKNMKQAKREERERELLSTARTALDSALGTKLSWTENGSVCECPLAPIVPAASAPIQYSIFNIPYSTLAPYRPISAYPFMLRDIAMWSDGKITKDDIVAIIRAEGGGLLVRDRLFDVFAKDFDGVQKTSYAFNLVFQSHDRTLSDVEVNEIMSRITAKLSERGLEVR